MYIRKFHMCCLQEAVRFTHRHGAAHAYLMFFSRNAGNDKLCGTTQQPEGVHCKDRNHLARWFKPTASNSRVVAMFVKHILKCHEHVLWAPAGVFLGMHLLCVCVSADNTFLCYVWRIES